MYYDNLYGVTPCDIEFRALKERIHRNMNLFNVLKKYSNWWSQAPQDVDSGRNMFPNALGVEWCQTRDDDDKKKWILKWRVEQKKVDELIELEKSLDSSQSQTMVDLITTAREASRLGAV